MNASVYIRNAFPFILTTYPITHTFHAKTGVLR
jgi:hypothetical protein